MQQIEFQLNGEYVELNQLLKMVCLRDSSGAGKAMVAEDGILPDEGTLRH
jgi:ribosome-associated protein